MTPLPSESVGVLFQLDHDYQIANQLILLFSVLLRTRRWAAHSDAH